MEKKYRDPWAARHDHQKVDLAFIVDCTASMGPYINQTQKNIRNITDQISKQAFNVKMALIEYRDHPPEDSSFITRVNDFTHSVDDMKKWVDGMKASGGGDSPEAVADALGAALQLNYRVDSTKICVLIADAPPHGLDQTGDGFPEGCPQGLDPLVCCQKMAEKGITLYFVGCEPSVLKYKDFYSGLALKTGGQYVPLQNPGALSKVVISATLEEVSLEKLMGYVDDFINLELRQKRHKTENRNVKSIKVDDLASELQKRLQITNTTCEQLQLNQESLGCASDMARKVSRTKNIAEARKLFISQLSMPVDYSVKSKDAEFTNAQSVFVSPAQSERLVLKSLARNKIPVTHDEKLGMIIVPDTVNVPVEL